jgi:hypothetical protein
MPATLDWDDAKMTRATELREPHPVAVITGCGRYLIQSRFFDESLWDYSVAPQVAFHIDDIWISGCLSRRGVKRYVVPASAMMRSVLRQRWTVSLNKIPGRQKLNNEIIAFFGRPGTSSLNIKDVGPCDGCGAATTEHRRQPGKLQRW